MAGLPGIAQFAKRQSCRFGRKSFCLCHRCFPSKASIPWRKPKQAIHQHYKRLVGSFQPVLEAYASTYIAALVIVADHKESLQEFGQPSTLREVVREKAILFAHPKAKRYRLLVLYQLVNQPEHYHWQDLCHLLKQLRLPFEPENYLSAA